MTNTGQLATVGTHTIACTATTGAGKKATASKNIKITYDPYNATNLYSNGSFENDISNWYNDVIELSSSYSKYGSKSAVLTVNNNQNFSRQNISNSYGYTGHKIYAKSSYLKTDVDLHPYIWLVFASEATYWPPLYNEIYNNDMSSVINSWNYVSTIGTANYNYLSNIMLVQGSISGSGRLYFDGLVIIDLTATFGSGNEPDKDWCDRHINYFDGTTTIYK